MSKLKLNITMSLDGYVAGPEQSTQHPLGIGGERIGRGHLAGGQRGAQQERGHQRRSRPA